MGFEGGPWGIVIIISAWMIQVMAFGVIGSLGIYNIEFLDYFQVSASEVSLIVAINFGVSLGSGPIVSYLMSKFSYRKIVLGGSSLIVLGLLSVPVFPNFYFMYLTLGVIVGFGICCVYIPSHTLSGLYYDKYRSLATGVVTSGSGFGLGVIPVLAGLFIDTYGWKSSFIVFAGINLHLFICGGLLRSPSALPKIEKEKNDKLLHDAGNNGEIHKKGVDMEVIVSDRANKSTEEYGEFELDMNGSVVALNEENGHLLYENREAMSHSNHDNLSLDEEALFDKNNFEKSSTKESKIPDTSRHIYIFKNFNFDVYFVNNVFWNMSVAMLSTFLGEYLHRREFSFEEVSWLVGANGYGAFVGSILGGIVGNIKGVNRTVLFSVTCLLLGLFNLVLPLGSSLVYVAIMIILAGLAFGVVLGLLIVVLTDIVGVESLGNGMGYLMFSNGLGTLIGPVFAGLLIDATGNYESYIYFSGILYVISGLIMFLIPIRDLKKCRKATV